MKKYAILVMLVVLGVSPFCPECDHLLPNHYDFCSSVAVAEEEPCDEVEEVKEEVVEEVDETEDVSEICEEASQHEVEQTSIEEYFWFDMGEFDVTAYCDCEKCCGYWSQYKGLTASGKPIEEGKTISVDPNLICLGAKVKIVFEDGTEHIYEAQDTGSAIKGNIIDLYIADHERAWNFGRQKCHVYVQELNDPRN